MVYVSEWNGRQQCK